MHFWGDMHSMTWDFDEPIERQNSDSTKWTQYDADVLPLWVADMDFRSPAPVIAALQERVAHGVFGYPRVPTELAQVVVERLERRYGWWVSEEDILPIPGCITGLNMACHAVGEPGDQVLVQTPVYGPFLTAPSNAGRERLDMELAQQADGRYVVDLDRFGDLLTPRAKIFLLCNPHNPVGRVFTREELLGMAEHCLRNEMIICSDEIHCDLVFRGHQHIPIASLAPEIAQATITLMSPSKTYNIAGLKCAVAIIPNAALRKRFRAVGQGLVPGINIMGYVAAIAAYRYGDDWLRELLVYLEGNCNLVTDFVRQELLGVNTFPPEGTYLSWLDCRQAGISENVQTFFLREARVALNDGLFFGPPGLGFVRLNFGCRRALLREALERMKGALQRL